MQLAQKLLKKTHIIARVLSQQTHQKDKVNRELVNRGTNDQ